MRKIISTAVVVAAIVIGGVANAEMSRGVIAAFKGQLVISKSDLPEGKNDKDTIAKIKGAKVIELFGSTPTRRSTASIRRARSSAATSRSTKTKASRRARRTSSSSSPARAPSSRPRIC